MKNGDRLWIGIEEYRKKITQIGNQKKMNFVADIINCQNRNNMIRKKMKKGKGEKDIETDKETNYDG